MIGQKSTVLSLFLSCLLGSDDILTTSFHPVVHVTDHTPLVSPSLPDVLNARGLNRNQENLQHLAKKQVKIERYFSQLKH